jgi:LuxR family maltose regulon positive regulatory protein
MNMKTPADAKLSENRFLPRLRSKLEVPSRVADHIQRPDLTERIAASGWARVTVLHAASGFGKTVAMADAFKYMSQQGSACSWITLDPADNDAGRFLFCLHQALHRVIDPAAPVSHSLGPKSEEELAADLFGLLDHLPSGFTLFLDEVEHLTRTLSFDLLHELLDILPEGCRIIAASRTMPALGQARLRAQGKLLELFHQDLAFRFQETESFLRHTVGSGLTVANIQQLQEKTEGWPVALRLAAGLLGRTSDSNTVIQQLARTDSVLSEFLVSEVLHAQQPQVQDFLLTTSILRDLVPELCDRLFPPGNSAQILETLSQSNAPISRTEGADGLFRHHGMFANFLRNTLRKERPDQMADLHRIAMSWFIEQGRIVPAIEHAIEGRDFETALSLLSDTGRQLLEQGRVRLLCRWYEAIPKALLQKHPKLMLQQGWAILFLHGPRKAQLFLDQTGLGAEGTGTIWVETLCLRTEIHSMLDDFKTALEAGELARPFEQLCSPFSRTVLLNGLAYAHFVEGRFSDARQTLLQARMEQSEHDDIFGVMFAESVQGLIDLSENRLREAMARFRVAASTTRSGTRHKTNGNLMAGIPLACCYYERNDLTVAARQFRLHLPFVRNTGPIDHSILCYCMLARIAMTQGDVDQALALLVELEDLGCRQQLPRVIAGAKLERARLYMLQEQFGRSHDELEQLQDPALWERVSARHLPANDLDTLSLHQIRLGLLRGAVDQIAPMIEDELITSRQQSRHRRTMVLDLLGAAAQLQQGRTETALTRAGRVLHQCAREGYIRLLIDEGPAVAAVVHAFAARTLQGERALIDPLFVDWLQELVSLLPAPSKMNPVEPDKQQLPLDPLTPKELEILSLLDQGLSNAAMSDKLCVSNSTVRTHLRNINSKLAASSRGQAVATARRIGVL